MLIAAVLVGWALVAVALAYLFAASMALADNARPRDVASGRAQAALAVGDEAVAADNRPTAVVDSIPGPREPVPVPMPSAVTGG